MGSLPLHVSGALRLRCRGAEVLPAESGEQHGGGQVHGRQVVGPGGEAGLRQGGLISDHSQDVQGLVPRRVGEGDLLQNLQERESESLHSSVPMWWKVREEEAGKHTHLLAVLGDDGLHGCHVGGLHHERDRLSLSDLHDSLEHHGVVVARRQCRYCHHLNKRGSTSSQM